MERRFLILFFIFGLAACGQTPGFKASDFDYNRVQSVVPKDKIEAQIKGDLPAKNSIVRFSNKIEFKPVETKWHQDQLDLKATVKVGDKSYGTVEFAGIRKNSRILLFANQGELADKLRAQLICLSEGDSCDEFFIDVVYKDSEVFIHDQIKSSVRVPKTTVTTSTTTSTTTTTTARSATTTTLRGRTATASPTTTTMMRRMVPATTTTTTLRAATMTTNREMRFPPTPPASSTESTKEILDGEPEVDTSEASYIGLSDEEIMELFKMPPPERAVKEPDSGKSTQTAGADRKDSTDKPQAPVKVGTDSPAKDDRTNSTTKAGNEAKKDDGEVTFESFRIRDQVIGSASAGRLERATDFFKLSQLPGMFFFVPHPSHKDYFGSFDLAVLLKKMGEALQAFMPGRKLAVTSVSKWGGGYLAPHRGHQNGTDIDIRYLTNDENQPSDLVNRGKVSPNLLLNHQWNLLKKSFETNMVEVVFVDLAIKKALCEEARRSNEFKIGENDSPAAEVLKRIQPWDGHDNHFHVRVRCSSDNPRCKRIPMIFSSVGC